MVRKGRGPDWKKQRFEKKNYDYFHFHSQPYFPSAKGVFSVFSAFKAGEERRRVVVVALRRIAREEHETMEGLEHMHSENLGGERGAYVAHVYKARYNEKQRFDYHMNCRNQDEVLQQFQHWFTKSNMQVDPNELKRIVRKVV